MSDGEGEDRVRCRPQQIRQELRTDGMVPSLIDSETLNPLHVCTTPEVFFSTSRGGRLVD